MQLSEQKLLSLVGASVSGHFQPPSIYCWDENVNHLHGFELFEHAAGSQATSMLFASLF